MGLFKESQLVEKSHSSLCRARRILGSGGGSGRVSELIMLYREKLLIFLSF